MIRALAVMVFLCLPVDLGDGHISGSMEIIDQAQYIFTNPEIPCFNFCCKRVLELGDIIYQNKAGSSKSDRNRQENNPMRVKKYIPTKRLVGALKSK